MKTVLVLVLVAVAGGCIALYTYAHWPIRCPECGSSFGTVDDRERHMRVAHNA